ncbi:MAG TPA: sulfite exporter TauE/SafE family protein [Brevundimonas sp.]
MLIDPMFYAVAIPAVILLGLTKGGFAGIGVVAVPMMALVISPVQAAAIILPILLAQDVVGVWSFRKTWDKGLVILMLPSAAVGILVGWLLAARVEVAAVELAIGLIAVTFSLQQLWAGRAVRAAEVIEAGPARRWLGVLCGLVSGFTSQVAHAGAPPFQIYVLPRRLPRDMFIGTSAVFFAAVNWMKLPAYIALGQFTPQVLTTAAVLLPLALVSTVAGVWLVRRVPAKGFYQVIYVVLAAVGVKLAWGGASGLLG